MMKEYYPDQYEKLKKYIAQGRWFVSGSSVDEGDVLDPVGGIGHQANPLWQRLFQKRIRQEKR